MAYGDEDRAASPVIGWTRLATGLVQGVAVWLLTEAADNKVWPATQGVLFGALAAVALFAPFVVLGGVAAMRRRTLVIWTLTAAAVLAALGAHDIDRRAAHEVVDWISGEAMIFLAAGLFIAHHLVAAAEADRRPIARFPTYFDQAWKHGVQLAMAAGFVGVFWIVLTLGGALFKLIGIDFVEELIRKEWFAIPATATMFAAAVQLTDVRHALIRGVRTVALTLLSWLLPVLVFLTGAFMVALPFTGLDPLWKTRSAAAILLSAAAVMIVLINAAYQDGEPDTPTPLVLRWAARLGGLLMLPLVAVAAYALWLRIDQYGLTPDRIIAAACVAVGAVHAVGYTVAAVWSGAWMKRLEITNIIGAVTALAVILALFSPIADTARLSVNDQMARIADGRLKPDKVDYRFLRFQSERYGVAALDRVEKKGGVFAAKVKEARTWKNQWSIEARPPEKPMPDEPNIGYRADPNTLAVIWPAGKALSAAFVERGWLDGDAKGMGCTAAAPCPAALIDLNGDGTDEVFVVGKKKAVVLARVDGADWTSIYQSGLDQCPGLADTLKAGLVEARPSQWRDLVVGEKRLAMKSERNDCEPVEPEKPMIVRPGPPPPPKKPQRIRPVTHY